MSSPPILDLATLLAPIPGDNPAGESLFYADTYDVIKEARRADDALEQGEWQRDIKTADWPAVIALTTEALATRSKDLQLASWLLEALVQQHYFAGLRDGLRLLQGLHAHFWEGLYPEVEDGDLEAREVVLECLNRVLPFAIRHTPVTQGEGYTWWHWQESRQVDNLGRQNKEAQAAVLAEGKITGEQFDKSVAAASRAYYETLLADVGESWEAYQQLAQVLDETFGRQAPSFLDIRKAIEECRTLLAGIVKQKRELEPDADSVDVTSPDTDAILAADSTAAAIAPPAEHPTPHTSSRARGAQVPLEPADRADALARLTAVAAYFRRAEPQTPAIYLIERAVRWVQMPLEAWLQTVIRDDSVLTSVRDTLGLMEAVEDNT
jgi:type VI secretion system protein ImpA